MTTTLSAGRLGQLLRITSDPGPALAPLLEPLWRLTASPLTAGLHVELNPDQVLALVLLATPNSLPGTTPAADLLALWETLARHHPNTARAALVVAERRGAVPTQLNPIRTVLGSAPADPTTN
jgi:hypothetical protein